MNLMKRTPALEIPLLAEEFSGAARSKIVPPEFASDYIDPVPFLRANCEIQAAP